VRSFIDQGHELVFGHAKDCNISLGGCKFCIGDDKAVITGSFNWSYNADKRNAENFVIVRLSYAVKDFKKEFEAIWQLNAS
jgi:hypothetical protein